MTPHRWCFARCDPDTVACLATELRVPPVIARVLVARGVDDPETAARFLDPRFEHLHDPMRLADMAPATDRIERALARGEHIGIHGDYDVDGITATVILRRALEGFGAQVVHLLPDRLRDGYGLGAEAIDRLAAHGVSLVISVDCGVRSHDAARRARQCGIDLIVTDHHEPDDALPEALAVINPKRRDSSYPDRHLSGAGVALKLVQALSERRGRRDLVAGFLKVAAIGTIADVVPLTGENRVIARLGLQQLSSGRHKAGLRALLEESALLGRAIDSHHVAFQLAPRLNAAGRMASPDLAAQLLLIADEGRLDEARKLARRLTEENGRRQQEERAILDSACEVVRRDPRIGAPAVIVVAGERWHRGVIGIVAAKLVEGFNRPAIVLAVEDGLAHGSCRSIPGFDMLAALERCADLLERFGGHRQAAGLTMRAEHIDEFRRRLADLAARQLQPDDLVPRLHIDGPLPLEGITPEVLEALDRLAPFGMGNPAPVFASGVSEVASGPRVLKTRHLDLSLRQGSRVHRAVMWRGAELLDAIASHRRALEVAYSLERTSFGGETTVELRVAAVRGAVACHAAEVPVAATRD